MRSKGLGGLEEHVRSTRSGPIHFHGKRDTYNLRSANLFLWDNAGINIDGGATCNYGKMVDWWRGMIALRKSRIGQVLRRGGKPPKGYYQWIIPEDEERALGYIVDGKLLVLLNTSENEYHFDFEHPAGDWQLIATNEQVEIESGVDVDQAWLSGSRSRIIVPQYGIYIWTLRS